MTILAFLQNMWVRDPARVAAIYARHASDPDRRAELNARFLFRQSLTGRRLRETFGDLCDRIVWEEISPRIAVRSDGCFPPDPEHIVRVFRHFAPDVTICFGKVSLAGLREAFGGGIGHVVSAPHPAARHAAVMDELRAAADMVRAQMAAFAESEAPRA